MLQCLFDLCRLACMRLHRFYVSQPLGEEVVIDDVSLISQLTKVFRYTIGDFVILFNGDGTDYSYSIRDITKKLCMLTCRSSSSSYIPLQKVILCLSIIKKDHFELVVQKATELGVTSIIPILSARSEKKNLVLDRLKKIAQESAEQCGRGDIPSIAKISTLQEVLLDTENSDEKILFDVSGTPVNEVKKHLTGQVVTLFIGPEGGWSPEDLALMNARKIKICSLGKTILRAETAAIVACAALIL